MKRGLREHWENPETGETGYVGSPGVFHFSFIGKTSGTGTEKKDEIFLRSAIGTAVLMCIEYFLRLCFFCRAAEVSRARREQLAKRERM